MFGRFFQIVIHTYMQAIQVSFYQNKNVTDIETVLHKEFANICDWFVDNELSIHFGDDKPKCILQR